MVRWAVAIILGFIISSSVSFAQEAAPQSIVTISPLPTVKELKRNELLFDSSYASFDANSSAYTEQRSISFGLGYNRAFTQFLQIGGRLGYSNEANSESNKNSQISAYSIRVGPTLNVGTSSGVENAYFLGLYVEQVSLSYSSVQGSGYSMSYGGTLGKRFQLLENVSFTPHLYAHVSTRYYQGSDNYDSDRYYYGIRLLSASVIW